MLDKRQFYINGVWTNPNGRNELDVVHPADEAVVARITLASPSDTDAAVAAAKAAFPRWSATSKDERLALLRKFQEIYLKRSEDMAQAITLEMGCPISLSRSMQVPFGTMRTESYITALERFDFDQSLEGDESHNAVLYEPIGVCALITPWNWPMNQIALKVSGALAAGCTMVLKPSEIAPLSGMLLADIIEEAGFPPGVFNVINGDGQGAGSQLCSHPDVAMISFTGSTRAGVEIQKNAAATVKRVCLELGGKGAYVVFDDADDQAVERGVRHLMMNSGQTCSAPTRMLVQASVYEQAIATAARVAASIDVGASQTEGPHMGPVASRAQYDKVQAMIESGIAEGARLVAGGIGRPNDLNSGFFVRPTVFADVDNTMTIFREEIFGPVLSITPFDTEEEAIRIANDTVYGLTNYVQTADLNKARRVSRQLRSGMVELNGQSRALGAPFGGYKQSGSGREAGIFGLKEFLEVKSVSGWNPV